jgi:hypothetical protein
MVATGARLIAAPGGTVAIIELRPDVTRVVLEKRRLVNERSVARDGARVAKT